MTHADLAGKTALVTGGASGIGLATATLLARNGATVAVNDLPDNPRLEQALAGLRDEGLAVVGVPGDLGRPDQARETVERALRELGRLDYLVNNAGTANTDAPIPAADLDRLDEDFWQRVLDVNLLGPFRCTRAAADALKQAGGAVVNTASAAAFGSPGSSIAYAASKAALVNLTRNLARALGPEARVNAVAPGYIATPWTARFGADWQALSVRQTCLKRAGTPEDVAEVIVFLCAGAGYVSGQTVLVDGGM